MIKAIAFDKDGTLMDYEAFWLPVGKAALRLLCAEENLPEETFDMLWHAAGGDCGSAGILCHGTYAAIVQALNLALGRECFSLTALRRAFKQCIGEGRVLPTCPNLPAVLHTLKAGGLILALITNDDSSMTMDCLARLGIADCFDAIYTDDGAYPPKPAPDALHAFCARFSLAPSEVLMVGDTESDMQFARNAGAIAALVASTPAQRANLVSLADRILYDVSELLS